MNQPKILILNQPFDNLTGGGITLSNLFDGWDADKLAIICAAQLISRSTNFEKCNNYYQLGNMEQKWRFPFSVFKKNNKSGPISGQSNYDDFLKVDGKKIRMKSKIINNYFTPFIKYSGLHQVLFGLEITRPLMDWVHSFKPALIYSQAQTLQEIKFCIGIHSKLNIPMIFHMMDDWISLGGQSSISRKLWKKKTEEHFKSLLLRCNQLLTISDYMSDEYFKRYGLKSISFHNPVDTDFWKKEQRNCYSVGSSPKILYAGRVGLGIDSSLLTMAKAVRDINKIQGSNLKFVLQTESIPNWFNQFDCVIHRDLVSYDSLPKIFSEADLLFLPYDFSPESIAFIQFSMPTKASEYMICGTPILIFAPEETAIVKYANNFNWAKVVVIDDLEVLKVALKEILFNTDLRKILSENAINLSEKYHSKFIVQKNFYDILRENIDKNKITGLNG